MKTIKFWSIITVAVFLTTMMFTSCEDPIEEPENQEIIESEVIDEGVSNNVTTQSISGTTESGNTATGTELSYESWIKVKTKTGPKKAPAYASTRAASGDDGDVVTVLLKDVFHNTDTTIYRSSLEFSNEYTTSVSYGVKGTRRDGYVTITDSVMVYTVSFEDFSFAYELEYEVAVYDDGVTKQTMPYHKITNLKDNGATIEALESDDDGINAYARMGIKHSLSIDFCGETYTLKGNVIIRKWIADASEPYLLMSNLVGSSATTVGSAILSRISVWQKWSNGITTTKNLEAVLSADIITNSTPAVTFHGYPNDIRAESSELSEVYERQRDDNSEMQFVHYEHCIQLWEMRYNYFTLSAQFKHFEAFYDDGITSCQFPCFEFTDISVTEPEITSGSTGTNENGHWTAYWFSQRIKAKFDKIEFSEPFAVELDVYDE